MPSNIDIEIIKTKMINKGNLKATIDFRLNSSEFYSWRIIKEEGKAAWVSPPQESYQGDDGGTKYKPLIKFNKELMKVVSDILLSEYANHL